jgi:dolichyl-phosphate beta-glucosyltransferase
MMDEAMPYLERRRETDPSFTYEVIVVNDGSRDGTSDVVLKYVRQYGVDKVRLLEFVRNRGKGGAIRMVCAWMEIFLQLITDLLFPGLPECSRREDTVP